MHYIKCMFLNWIPCQVFCVFSLRHLLHVLSPPPTSSIIFGDLQIVGTLLLFFNAALVCALAFRMTTNSLCLTKTSTQKWDPSWSEATTVRPAASSFSSTIWPWTRSTSRSAGRRWWRSWMAKTTWTGGFEKQKKKKKKTEKKEVACTGGRRECS